jgi:hypothetical protein
MCDLNQKAHFLCGLTCASVRPQLHKLDIYLEPNDNVGFEKWFQVELAAELSLAGYSFTISPTLGDGTELDLEIKRKANQVNPLLVELKAGSYCGGRDFDQLRNGAAHCDNQNWDRFIGCLFLGRFDWARREIRLNFEENGYDVVALEYVGGGPKKTKWWVGVARRKS